MHCLGNGEKITYKKSRIGNSLADKAVLNVVRNLKYPNEIWDFFPDGGEERQFCTKFRF